MFAPNTIEDCYHLAYSEFDIEVTENQESVNKKTTILNYYEEMFSKSTELPCEGFSLERVFLKGEKTLYNMKRCLYISSENTISTIPNTPFSTYTNEATTEQNTYPKTTTLSDTTYSTFVMTTSTQNART